MSDAPSASPTPAAAKVPANGAWTTSMLDIADDPVVCLLGYCLPCVQYGMTAERVHGPANSMPMHCLKFYVYSFVCLCGLVTGPTRKAIRDSYNLPISPDFVSDQSEYADCIVGTVPCVNCFALCQDAREVNHRNPSGPLRSVDPFNWAPLEATTTTAAPVQEEMTK